MKYTVVSENGWEGFANGATVTDPNIDEGSLAVVIAVGVLVPQDSPTKKVEEKSDGNLS
jgi:hydrogenase/urease accessory protein HupE